MSQVWTPAARPSYGGPLLLDTHLWLWILEPALGSLPPAAEPVIRAAAARQALHVSDISYWEVGQKTARGKLALTTPPLLWATRAQTAPGIRAEPVTRDILLLSTTLTTMHKDPADRILVATAKVTGIPLTTMDQDIIDWATSEGQTPLCDCRL